MGGVGCWVQVHSSSFMHYQAKHWEHATETHFSYDQKHINQRNIFTFTTFRDLQTNLNKTTAMGTTILTIKVNSHMRHFLQTL